MSQNKGRAKLSEKGLLTPDNCVVALIDLQPQMLFGVSNFDRQSIINNNVLLAKAAKVFGVPLVLSTVETKGFSGNLWPQVQAVFPKQVPRFQRKPCHVADSSGPRGGHFGLHKTMCFGTR